MFLLYHKKKQIIKKKGGVVLIKFYYIYIYIKRLKNIDLARRELNGYASQLKSFHWCFSKSLLFSISNHKARFDLRTSSLLLFTYMGYLPLSIIDELEPLRERGILNSPPLFHNEVKIKGGGQKPERETFHRTT